MGLEVFNGNLSDLVITNPPGTDPKSQGDDHLRGIKKTLVDTFGATTGPIYGPGGVRFPDATVQGSAALSAFIGANQSLADSGYQKLPGGLIVQWGTAQHTSNAGSGWSTAAFPIAFPTGVFQVTGTCITAAPEYNAFYASLVLADIIPASFSWVLYDKTGTPVPGTNVSQFRWIAIGY